MNLPPVVPHDLETPADREIRTTFDQIVQTVCDEFPGSDVSNHIKETYLVFIDECGSFMLTGANVIYFSRPSHECNTQTNSMKEYKNVLRQIEVPYFCDCRGDWVILTPEPHVYVMVHELCHAALSVMYEFPVSHGMPEFGMAYSLLLALIQPKTFVPTSPEEFMIWGDPDISHGVSA